VKNIRKSQDDDDLKQRVRDEAHLIALQQHERDLQALAGGDSVDLVVEGHPTTVELSCRPVSMQRKRRGSVTASGLAPEESVGGNQSFELFWQETGSGCTSGRTVTIPLPKCIVTSSKTKIVAAAAAAKAVASKRKGSSTAGGANAHKKVASSRKSSNASATDKEHDSGGNSRRRGGGAFNFNFGR
jgi:hypothetical protein